MIEKKVGTEFEIFVNLECFKLKGVGCEIEYPFDKIELVSSIENTDYFDHQNVSLINNQQGKVQISATNNTEISSPELWLCRLKFKAISVGKKEDEGSCPFVFMFSQFLDKDNTPVEGMAVNNNDLKIIGINTLTIKIIE